MGGIIRRTNVLGQVEPGKAFLAARTGRGDVLAFLPSLSKSSWSGHCLLGGGRQQGVQAFLEFLELRGQSSNPSSPTSYNKSTSAH